MTNRVRCTVFAVFFGAAAVGVVSAQVVVDNDGGAPGYVETGAWSQSGAAGYNGGIYRFANVGAASTATWTATLADAGTYEVFVWYVAGSNRATSTRYVVGAAGGDQTVFLNQVGGGLSWVSLGSFSFNAGAATVTLDAAGSTGGDVVISDAVSFGGAPEVPCTSTAPEVVGPGVTHVRYDCPGPQVIHVVEYDLADPTLMIEMGFSQKKRNYSAKEPVTTIASRYDSASNDVLAAVNCAFFEADLGIIGLLGGGSNLVGTRTDSNQTYILQESGEGFAASNIPTTAKVRFADGTENAIGVLNERCATNALVLYTPDWGTTTGSSAQRVEVIIEDVNYPFRPNKKMSGVITAVKTGAASVNNAIPAGGMVLASCTGADAILTAHAAVGDIVEITYTMPPTQAVNAHTLATGNIWIVKDGAIHQTGGPERHPRTAIAWSGTHHWFVTWDGRQPGYAVGVSYAEMSDFLLEVLEVDNAINLDGGGSTTLVVNGVVRNCPSDNATIPCAGTPRSVPNALMLVKRNNLSTFPLADDFPATGRTQPWRDKFNSNPVVPFSPPAPDSDGYALEVRNTTQAFETTSLGARGDADYITRALLYCAYRPELAANGYERYGIFARDDGNANFDRTAQGGGNCYAMTFDTHTGRIRAGVIVEGVFTDFLEATPYFATSSAWRQFRIDCQGQTIRYLLDGTLLHETTDATRATGTCGIGYSEYFTTNANIQGAHAASFTAKKPFTGDYNKDGDCDLTDFTAVGFCLQGPTHKFASGHLCLFADSDDDRDVDVADFMAFQQVFTGPL